MKKILSYMIAVFVVMTCVAAAATTTDPGIHNRGMSYVAPQGHITIDGKIDDAWEAAEWTYINVPYHAAYTDETPTTYDYGGTECRSKVMWEEGLLYILVQVNNEYSVFDQDIIEIYIEEGTKTQGGFSDYGYQIRFQYKKGKLSTIGGTNPTEFELDEICPESEIKLTNSGKTANMEFKIRMLDPAGHAAGGVIGLEYMIEDYRQFDGIWSYGDIFRWNVVEVDENGPTGVNRPYGESLNYGDLILADENGKVPVGSQSGDGFPWFIVLIIVCTLAAVGVAVAVIIAVRKRKASKEKDEE